MGYLHRDFLRENGFKSTYLFKRAEIFLFLDANLTWDFKLYHHTNYLHDHVNICITTHRCLDTSTAFWPHVGPAWKSMARAASTKVCRDKVAP